MNRLIFFLLFGLPHFSSAQKVFTLLLNQPPELGFTIFDTQTTINKGDRLTLGQGIIINGGSGNYRYSWSPGQSLNDSTLLRPLAQPEDTTTYTLTVTDLQGCSFSLSYTVNVKDKSVSSGLIREKGTLQAILFPNPGNGEFSLKITGLPAPRVDITITDHSGRVLMNKPVGHFTGETTETFRMQLARGVYLIRIDTGTEACSASFIIR